MSFFGLAAPKLPVLTTPRSASMIAKVEVLRDRRVLMILMVSLCAAISSLGMYTFIAPLLSGTCASSLLPVAAYLWVWGIGGVVGSFLIGRLADRYKGPVLSLWIMVILTLVLFSLPTVTSRNAWLVMVPIAIWGAVGWALQVPQNNQLISARETHGDGNLAVALNGSALYLGSALGAALGGLMLLQRFPVSMLAYPAAGVAAFGAVLQGISLRWRASDNLTAEDAG